MPQNNHLVIDILAVILCYSKSFFSLAHSFLEYLAHLGVISEGFPHRSPSLMISFSFALIEFMF